MDPKIIFRNDGTLKGLSFSKASKTRGAVLQISTGRGKPNPLLKSIVVEGKDFDEAYRKAVELIADYHGGKEVDDFLPEMHETKKLFITANDLVVRSVSYMQVYTQDYEAADT